MQIIDWSVCSLCSRVRVQKEHRFALIALTGLEVSSSSHTFCTHRLNGCLGWSPMVHMSFLTTSRLQEGRRRSHIATNTNDNCHGCPRQHFPAPNLFSWLSLSKFLWQHQQHRDPTMPLKRQQTHQESNVLDLRSYQNFINDSACFLIREWSRVILCLCLKEAYLILWHQKIHWNQNWAHAFSSTANDLWN